MDVNFHTNGQSTTVQLREFGITDAIRQPFVTLDLLQKSGRLSIFLANDPEGRLIASKMIELLQEAFFTPQTAPAAASDFAAADLESRN